MGACASPRCDVSTGGALGRLKKGEPFDRVYREGTVVAGPFFVLRVLGSETDGSRWGFAVGKRLEKRAVARNRVRRRLREAARGLEHPPAGVDVVVTARGPSLAASVAVLRDALDVCLARAASRGGTRIR